LRRSVASLFHARKPAPGKIDDREDEFALRISGADPAELDQVSSNRNPADRTRGFVLTA